MYENLKGRLEELAKIELHADGMGVYRISAEGVEIIKGLANEAADAIEELSKIRDAACWGCKCEKIEPSRWIPVKDRLPEDGQYVLAYSADDDFTTVEARHHFAVFQITHWQPLPEPPKEES